MVERVALGEARRLGRRKWLLRNGIGLQGLALGERTSEPLLGRFGQALTDLYVLLGLLLFWSLGPRLVLKEVSVDDLDPFVHRLAVASSEQPLLQLPCFLELHLERRDLARGRRASEERHLLILDFLPGEFVLRLD